MLAYFVKTSQCDFFLDKRLVDIDLGDFDQSTYESSNEHLKNHPETDYVFPNGESFLQVRLSDLKNLYLKSTQNTMVRKY